MMGWVQTKITVASSVESIDIFKGAGPQWFSSNRVPFKFSRINHKLPAIMGACNVL